MANSNLAEGPSLDLIGRIYLAPVPRTIFLGAALLQFMSYLVSFGIAMAEIVGDIFGVSYGPLIPVVILPLCLLIIFGYQGAAPVISFITILKVVLLTILIGLSIYVSFDKDLHPTTSWAHGFAPFLLGTVALGGAVNLMPVLYGLMEGKHIHSMKRAVQAGVAVVYVFGSIWCFFILQCVPQTEEDATEAGESSGMYTRQNNLDFAKNHAREKDYPAYTSLT